MRDVEAAWVAAMIEAEGSVVVAPPHSLHRAKITLINADAEVLSALLRLTGTGSCYAASMGRMKLSRKPLFVWSVQAWHDIIDLVHQCAPYSMKLQRIEVPDAAL